MSLLRDTLMASLLTGAALGGELTAELRVAEGIDALARDFADAADELAVGIDARLAALSSVDAWTPLPLETLAVVAPLADRLGLSAERARLEDQSFKAMDPVGHAALAAAVGTTLDADQARVSRLIDGLAARVAGLGVLGQVDGRVKSLWSLQKKMRRKGVPVDAVVDRLAMRVRVDSVADCYAVQRALLAAFPAVEGELDDYIAHPKANGYQSLHLALVFPDAAEPVEVQIRTHAMHARAEAGDAAHWRYKLA